MATLIAAQPSQGIRVLPIHGSEGSTWIQVVDDGRRGYPAFSAVVAVQREGSSYKLRAPRAESIFCVEVKGRDTADRLIVPDLDWPPDAATALLVLLYHDDIVQPASPRGAGAPENALRLANGAPLPPGCIGPESPDWVPIVDAIECLLGKEAADRFDNARVEGLTTTGGPKNATKGNPAPMPVCFALMSCQYPCDILDHMPVGSEEDPGPADASLLALGKLLNASGGELLPTLLLMAGDQIYVDATAGLFDPKSQDDKYRNPYHTFFASRGPQAVLNRRNVDVRMMLDDHEIGDNWEPGDEPASSAKDTSPLYRGLRAFREFQRPGPATASAQTYEFFERNGVHFFLADTRTEREPRTARDFADKLIMGNAQFGELTQWLSAHSRAAKFVLTPSILLPRRLSTARDPGSGLHSDAWDGYPRSLFMLLEWICEQQVRDLVFLSGDEHLGCDAAVTVARCDGRAATSFRSVHCPALYAPYPFANSIEEDFPATDEFNWTSAVGVDYVCTVRACFPAGRRNGFVLISTSVAGGGQPVQVEFRTV